MKICPKYFACALFVIPLMACHPTYTAKQSEHYVGQLGVTSQFSIDRSNNRAIANNSRLCVILERNESIDSTSLSAVIVKGLLPFFSINASKLNASTAAAAASLARKNGADVAVFVQVLDVDALKPKKNAATSVNFNKVGLLLTLVDSYNEQIIDKIQLTGKSNLFSLIGTDLASLLKKPINKIGRDLSGV